MSKNRVAEHLRYPGSDDSPLIGSDVGREPGNDPKGRNDRRFVAGSIAGILVQSTERHTPSRDSSANRLVCREMGRIGEAAEAFVVDRADTLLREMRSPGCRATLLSSSAWRRVTDRASEWPIDRTGTTEAVRSFLEARVARAIFYGHRLALSPSHWEEAHAHVILRAIQRRLRLPPGLGSIGKHSLGHMASRDSTQYGDQFVLRSGVSGYAFRTLPANPADVFSGGGVYQ